MLYPKSTGLWKSNQNTKNNKACTGEAESFWNRRMKSSQDHSTEGQPPGGLGITFPPGCSQRGWVNTAWLKLSLIFSSFCPELKLQGEGCADEFIFLCILPCLFLFDFSGADKPGSVQPLKTQ